MSKGKLLTAVAIVTLGWIVAGVVDAIMGTRIGLSVMVRLGWPRGWILVRQMIGWLIGGGVTAVVMCRVSAFMSARHAMALMLGWALAGPVDWRIGFQLRRVLSPAVPFSFRYNPQVTPTWPIGIMIGAFVAGLIFRRANRAVRWQHALIMASGWIAGHLLFQFIEQQYLLPYWAPLMSARAFLVLRGAVHGALFGLSGMGVVAWQMYRRKELTVRPVSHELSSNPELARLLARTAPPSLGATLTATALLLAISFVFSVLLLPVLPFSRTTVPDILLWMPLLPLAVTAIPPVITAGVAASLAARGAQRQHLELLRTTLLPRRKLIWGYVQTALYRIRLLIALEIVVMPVICMMILHISTLFFRASQGITGEKILMLLAASAGLLGMNLLAAVVGVVVGFSIEEPGGVVALSTFMVLGVSGCMLLVLLSSDRASVTAWVSEGLGMVLFAAAPYVVGAELVDSMALSWGG